MSAPACVLAIEEGTTSTRAFLFDSEGEREERYAGRQRAVAATLAAAGP